MTKEEREIRNTTVHEAINVLLIQEAPYKEWFPQAAERLRRHFDIPEPCDKWADCKFPKGHACECGGVPA
jgi:hypothetical protein